LRLSGTVLSGGKSNTRERVENDFYATPINATLSLLDHEPLSGKILEPACGQGHIIKAILLRYPKEKIIHGSDIVRRTDIFNLFSSPGGVALLTQKLIS